MARLPQPWELSGPVSQRSGRQYIAADTTAIGEGIASFGASLSAIGRERQQQENAVDIARAEAYKTQELLRVSREFDNDPDYATYDKRAPKVTGDVVNKAASVIRDPAMRERWQLGATTDAARTNDAIFTKGDALKKQTEIVGMDDALETQRRIYVDPTTTEEQKDLARRDIEATISVGESTGLFSPVEAEKRRQAYLEAADLSRALLVAENDPDAVAGYGDPTLPAGMRNNNPGNIKYVGQGREKGVIGPSENTDQGDPQAVFVTPEAGMREAYRLAMSKYNGGKTTANDLIAGDNGWTPGNYDAAANIARGMGLSPDDDLNLSDPASAQKFLRALVTQEHGKASAKYSDALIARAVSGGSATLEDLPVITSKQAGRSAAPDMEGVNPDLLSTFKKVQNAFGRSIPIVSGFRGAARNAAAGGAKGSQHLEGNAIDLDVSDMSKDERLELIRVASSMGITGIGVYNNSLHLDVGQRRAWGPSYGIESVPAWAKDAINEHLAGASKPIGAGRTRPAYIDRLSPEDRQRVFDAADRKRKELSVESRAAIDIASANAPTAVQNFGQYDGTLPTMSDFVGAYGSEGVQKYQEFSATMDVSRKAFDMRTMSIDEIQSMVEQAKPTSAGNDAALQQKTYEMLSSAAQSTIKAREADPVAYVQQTFPAVKQQWDAAAESGDYQAAMAATAAAQTQLGIDKIRMLPKEVAENTIARFKDENIPGDARVAAVTGLVFSTPDQTQRRAIYEQLVEAGLPDTTEGAMDAFARGDMGAGRRLMEAAIIDPAKLPGASPYKTAEINEAIQTQLMDEGQIGDLVYGLSDGVIENQERAIRDGKLLANAVNIRVRSGEDLDAAVLSAAKDLYGDVQAVSGNAQVNAQLVLPADADPEPVLSGLAGIMPTVRSSLEAALAIPDSVLTSDGSRAVVDAARQNYIDNVMAEGYFRNAEGGFVFIDPYVGAAIAGPDGKPMIFTEDQVKNAPAAPAPAVVETPNAAGVVVPKTQEEIDLENYGPMADMLKQLQGSE